MVCRKGGSRDGGSQPCVKSIRPEVQPVCTGEHQDLLSFERHIIDQNGNDLFVDALRKLQLSCHGTALRRGVGMKPQNSTAVWLLQLSGNDPAPVLSALNAVVVPDAAGHLLELFQNRVDLLFIVVSIADKNIVLRADVGQLDIIFIIQFFFAAAGLLNNGRILLLKRVLIKE